MSENDLGNLRLLDDILKEELKKASELQRQYAALAQQADAAKTAAQTARRRAAAAHAAAQCARAVMAPREEPAPNIDVDKAQAFYASFAYAYRDIENTATRTQSSFAVIHVDGEKIASIIRHRFYHQVNPNYHQMRDVFSVAGWKTAEGSPAQPFDTLEEALTYVTTLTRADPAKMPSGEVLHRPHWSSTALEMHTESANA
ncbi:hypothetical protein KIKIMORA_04400 [Brevundimonas phage vB_BpoS-Kikimora]|uniref:Uncharacterized protein n=1 Tax=Brevundimonas phage vB_BpoS-Kikimora TaxID=2948601 RepID=A0A9E7MRY1_9CAUD|nr:hypothetical protein KIKIMORA_04400 [Brevundimonas phage vB_BpoS-Kikimora]